MNFDEVTLIEIEDYIQALDENVGLKVETIQDIAQAISKQRGLVKKLTIPVVINLVCPKCGNTGRCEPRTLSDPDGQECDCGQTCL